MILLIALLACSPPPSIPSTGMSAYDRVVPELMERWDIPGCAVTVARAGRIVFSRGYGSADVETGSPVRSDSRFRLASVSKPITAVAVLRLVEQGALALDAPVLDYVGDLLPAGRSLGDPRWKSITIRHLLQHRGGFDAVGSLDPMFANRLIASEMNVSSPPSPETIVGWMLQRPLEFPPGARYAYSNFGYCLLGRVISRVTGQTYESWVRENVVLPAGASGLRLGRTPRTGRLSDEVVYYMPDTASDAESVFDGATRVPWPYGGWSIESMDAHGGWTGSSEDVMAFLLALDHRHSTQPLLSAATLDQMLAPPTGVPPGTEWWYGMGLNVRPSNGDANWWHMGSLDGTTALMVRTWNDLDWVVLCNSRPADFETFDLALDRGMWEAAGGVTAWPP